MPASSPFAAGLALASHKAAALSGPIRVVPPPAIAVVALDQGAGLPARPIVAAGDRVWRGSAIGQGDHPACATVHSPVAGRVLAVESRQTASDAGAGLCVIIENDGSDASDARHEPLADYTRIAPETLLSRIRDAGIVGLGGAAFATATKLAGARGLTVSHLVLNGAECEPWICCDDALMRERATDVVLGAAVLMHVAGIDRCTIAVEDDKPEAIAALRAALAQHSGPAIELFVLPAMYPAGAERQLLTTVTGLEVPAGGLPADVGLLCQNVGTAAAVARLVRTGEPCVARIVTVTGGGVARPGNCEARVGTPLAALVDACGGYAGAPQRLIAGGSMTGRSVATDEVGLTKAMNCIVAAVAADLTARGPEMPCIRCGDCANVCPAGLLPQQLHRAVQAGDFSAQERWGLADCIECGCCDYVCPSQIPLTPRFRDARTVLRRREADAQRAADARVRYERHERRLREEAEAERAAFDAARRRARAGDAEPPAGS